MKKSISVWSFPNEWSLKQKLALTKEAGFEGFEIDLTENGPVNFKSTESELKTVRNLAEKNSLSLSGLATGLYWGANAVSASAETRENAASILKRQIESAKWLGIDAILVVPGTVGVDFIPGAEVVPYDLAWERARTFIQAALPLAEKSKIKIGIENVWNKFLLSPLEMRSFISEFQSEWVGVYFDVGNTLATGYPEHWISILAHQIVRIHFKDYRRAVGTVDGFVELLSGDVNWPNVMTALKKAGYKGWIAAEMIPPMPFYKSCPEVLIHNTSRAMDAIFRLDPTFDSSLRNN